MGARSNFSIINMVQLSCIELALDFGVFSANVGAILAIFSINGIHIYLCIQLRVFENK